MKAEEHKHATPKHAAHKEASHESDEPIADVVPDPVVTCSRCEHPAVCVIEWTKGASDRVLMPLCESHAGTAGFTDSQKPIRRDFKETGVPDEESHPKHPVHVKH
jgi:hypothetical protein